MLNKKGYALVSIIIPSYNYGHFICRAIDSAINQTYPNIEIVVVDDGSTDDTLSRISDYGDKIQIVSQANQGASAARNRGIQEASGEFIAFLDADDCYRPENIAKKMNVLLAKDSQYQWCYSNCIWINEQGEHISRGDEMPEMLISQKAEGNVLQQALAGALLGSNLFVFHREVLVAVGGFDEKLRVLEDYALYVFVAALFPIAYIDEVLVDIHTHEKSLSQSGKWVGYISRWRINNEIERRLMSEVEKVGRPWRLIQADVYRNLAELSYSRGKIKQATSLLRKSLSYHCFQPGALKLWFKLH